jgi:hypothetical protein
MLNPDAHKLLPILMLGGILFNIGTLCFMNGNGLVTEDMGTGEIAKHTPAKGEHRHKCNALNVVVCIGLIYEEYK